MHVAYKVVQHSGMRIASVHPAAVNMEGAQARAGRAWLIAETARTALQHTAIAPPPIKKSPETSPKIRKKTPTHEKNIKLGPAPQADETQTKRPLKPGENSHTTRMQY